MKKEKYVAAIVPVLKECGLKITMDEIALKIGATKKTLYNQFGSRELMIEECLDEMTRQYRKNLACMDDRTIPAHERFVNGVKYLRQYFKDIAPVFISDLMKIYPQKASMDHAEGRTFFENKLVENIKVGQLEGDYRADLDPGLIAKYIAYAVFSFFKKEVMNGSTYSADFYFEQIITFNVSALVDKG